MYKHILLPFDGSPLSDKALREGIALARSSGAKISLIYVLAPHHLLIGGGRAVPGLKDLEQQYHEQLLADAQALLARAQREAAAAGLVCAVEIEHGTNPHEHIVAAARRLNCDVIVMASHGRRGIDAIVIGSQTVKVLTHASVPVLVVR
jgi:nucleotide-binding universal stress UspA family protein